MQTEEQKLFKKAEDIYHEYGEDRYPRAIEAFQILLEGYPENHKGWNMLSFMQSSYGLYDDAIRSIDEAIKLDTKNIHYWKSKQLLLSNISRLDFIDGMFFDQEINVCFEIKSFKDNKAVSRDFIAVSNTLLKMFPEDDIQRGRALKSIARIAFKSQMYSESIDAYTKAITFFNSLGLNKYLSDIKSCLLSISKVYEETHNYDKALYYIEERQKNDESNILLTHKARVLRKMGQGQKANQTTNEFLARTKELFLSTTDSAYMFQIASHLAELERFDEALETISEMSPKALKYEGLQESISEERDEILKLQKQTLDKNISNKKPWWKLW